MSRLIIAITPSVALVSPHSKEILINFAHYNKQSSCEMYPAQDLTMESLDRARQKAYTNYI